MRTTVQCPSCRQLVTLADGLLPPHGHKLACPAGGQPVPETKPVPAVGHCAWSGRRLRRSEMVGLMLLLAAKGS